MSSKKMYLRSRIRSISYALDGIASLVKEEPNARIHLAATILVIAAGIIQCITVSEWMALIFAIGLVWITEAFNTALEKFCDLATEGQWHPMVKIIKDIAAAAVLIAAAVSVVIGILVFIC